MSKRLGAALCLVCCTLILPADASAARWAVDPAVPGPDLPTEGRSLFDSIAADGLPFPFEALVRKIERSAGCRPDQCGSAVLIPLGRSLQRASAAPDFFAAPRVVVAVTGEGSGMFARDRIYLGYQERADLIEVISYNEAAGRFEFQLVRNYRAGGTPELVYAARAVCTSCHQNHAPIFARQIWDETNANPAIADALTHATGGARRSTIQGVSVRRGVDIPNAIDDATDRANLLAVIQRIWREACDSSCRAQALTAALQYRLSGERAFVATPPIAAGFAARFPDGLAIPNPDLPNRDPLTARATGMVQVDVPGPLEPLVPRAPLSIWRADDPLLAARFVAALAAQIAEQDLNEFEATMRSRAVSAPRRGYSARCIFTDARYDCSGDFALRGEAERIEMLEIGGRPLARLRLEKETVTSRGRPARTASGDAIERLKLSRSGTGGAATLTVVEDFAASRTAITRADWPTASLQRGHIRAALGLRPLAHCCGAAELQSARVGAEPAQPLPDEAEAFVAPCARCHRTPESTPPNFLAGDAARVRAALVQCAPRIFVRLAMWDVQEAQRAKVPMPPPAASREGVPATQIRPEAGIAALQAKVAAWLRAEQGRPPDVALMLARGYENLRPCLPAS